MIDLYFWPTGNGKKIVILLEELGLPYTFKPINIGRGETVRLDDLNAAITAGSIAGAAIDVSELEPLPHDHPLWRAPNVIITPHVAGFGSDTDAKRQAVIVENARHFVRGEPLRYVIDKSLRY